MMRGYRSTALRDSRLTPWDSVAGFTLGESPSVSSVGSQVCPISKPFECKTFRHPIESVEHRIAVGCPEAQRVCECPIDDEVVAAAPDTPIRQGLVEVERRDAPRSDSRLALDEVRRS